MAIDLIQWKTGAIKWDTKYGNRIVELLKEKKAALNINEIQFELSKKLERPISYQLIILTMNKLVASEILERKTLEGIRTRYFYLKEK